ncbi:Heat shock protein 12A [Elsinoe australis]|uniref:Heat shock protein 12A n=1 Tax=Elsinoe australis TaxID=40998 RepID=A0A2P7YW90_9PEZI|nr:Heat shock protein 12A [Elsinoe australis]
MMAGRNAGMKDLRMASEPEAAAAFALTVTEDLGLRKGDIWTLCDLGAGTGVLITYEIMSLVPLTLREIVEGILNHEKAGVKIGQLVLSNEQLFALFEPEILKILGLIESQVVQARRQVSGMVPRGVILVGGFSQSRYLCKRIQTHFAN